MRVSFLIGLLCIVFVATAQPNKYNQWLYQNHSFADNIDRLIKTSEEARQKGNLGMYIYYQYILGEYYEQNGRLIEAEKIFTAIADLAQKQRPTSLKKIALIDATTQKTWFDPSDRLGFFYLKIGNTRKAEDIFIKSLEDRNNFFPAKSVHRLIPMVGLGAAFYQQKQYDKAYQYYQQALDKLWKTTTHTFDLDNVARLAYYDLVELNITRGKLKEAGKLLEYLTSASSGYKNNSKAMSYVETARIFEIMTRYEIAMGRPREAKVYLDKGFLFIAKSKLESTVTFKLLRTQAILQWTEGNLSDASTSFKTMVDAYNKYLSGNFKALSENEKEKFYYTIKEDFDLFNSFVLHCHDKGLAERYGLYEVILHNQLKIKGLLLGDAALLQNRILNSGSNELIKTYKDLQNARAELSALYFKKDSEARITEINALINSYEKTIQQSLPDYTNETSITWLDLQRVLKKGELAAEMVRVRHFEFKEINEGNKTHRIPGLSNQVSYLTLIITPEANSLSCFAIKNGQQLESRYAKLYRNLMLTQQQDEQSYANYWVPFYQQLTGVKKIYFSGDGIYSQINLNTLYNSEKNRYVIDEVDLQYVTSIKDLLKTTKTSAPNRAFLFGRPNFNGTFTEGLDGGLQRSLISEELTSLKDQDFQDLPGTEAEIKAIEKSLLANAWTVKLYQGMDATEKNVKALDNPTILHLATHGFFIEDSTGVVNPMIRSGLLFSGVNGNANSSLDDGILTAYEAAMLNLKDTRLVVLSACETGLGETRYGEGVYGLQRAMITAGANNLLMSLWKVDDTATNLLMSEFYRSWNQGEAADAFRVAQKKLRTTYAHPYYWGAFIMLGK
jgi:CHAT domain-containing protein